MQKLKRYPETHGMISLNDLYVAIGSPRDRSPKRWLNSHHGARPLITLFGDTKECCVEALSQAAPGVSYCGGMRCDTFVTEPLALAYAMFVGPHAYWMVWQKLYGE